MSSRCRWIWLALSALLVASACGGGDGADGAGAVGGSDAYYTTTCEETACEACSDHVSSDCSACHSLCLSSSDTASCLGTCSNICATSCSACSRAPVCKKHKTTLPLPPLDRDVYEACLAEAQACNPEASVIGPQEICHNAARTLRHEVADELRCTVDNDCQPCGMPSAPGTIGSEACEREKSCGFDCSFPFPDGAEHRFRPELVRGLRACLAESDCEAVRACLFAYGRLSRVGLDPQERVGDVYAIDDSPETHADDHKWYAACSSSASCGSRLQCVKPCKNCDSFCQIPCATNADCVGQYIGVDLAYYCRRITSDGAGYCGWN
ncbi:MAG: hypothetical protein K0R38_2323 [Polyangiaceae bacterium]|nr:hypothetical protein [Polyangiaceae bacterium]